MSTQIQETVANALLNRFEIQHSSPEAAVALENFVVTRDGIPELALEVKSTSHPKPDHFRGLRTFAEEFPQCQKILLCFAENPSLSLDGIRIEPVGPFLMKGWTEFCETRSSILAHHL